MFGIATFSEAPFSSLAISNFVYNVTIIEGGYGSNQYGTGVYGYGSLDSLIAGFSYAKSLTEAGSASDAETNIVSTAVTRTESGSATDANTNILTALASASEASSAAHTNTNTLSL